MNTPNYDSWSIKEIKEMIKNKEIIVPTLQRDMVWNNQDIKKLQNSLMKGYPIGTLILNKKKIDGKTIYYLLDGLQRTSSLIKIIRNKYKNLPKARFKNIVKEAKIKSNIKNLNDELLYKLITENSDKFSSLKLNSDKVDYIIKNKEKIFNVGKDETEYMRFTNFFIEFLKKSLPNEEYKVPFISYEDNSDNLDNSAEIFKLLNTQGTPLTELEILASIWNEITIKINDHSEFSQKFLRIVKDRYISLEELEIYRDYENIDKSLISPFELIYGIAKLVSKDTNWKIFKNIFVKDGKIQNLNIMLFILKWYLFNFQKDSNNKPVNNQSVGMELKDVFDNDSKALETFINFIKKVTNEIHESFSIFSFKANGTSNDNFIKFGNSYIAWFLIKYIKNNYDSNNNKLVSPKSSNSQVFLNFMYKIVDESFGSGSVKNAYKDILLSNNFDYKTFEENLIAKSSQIANDQRRVNFSLWVKAVMSWIYLKLNKKFSIDDWKTNKFHEDHLIPKAKIRKFFGVASIGNYSLIIDKDNFEKSDLMNVDFLKRDFIFENSSEDSKKNQIKIYNELMENTTQEKFNDFLKERNDQIFEILENSLNTKNKIF